MLRASVLWVLLPVLFACAGGRPPAPPAAVPPAPPRLILLSWDGTPAWVVDRLLAEGELPHLARLAARGARAGAVTSTFPTKTAVAHATLWTGAWPGTHGITANDVTLADGAHTLLDEVSGFRSDALRAEPIWVTAARAGRRTVVLSATQTEPATPHLDALRQAGVPASSLVAFNGFDHRIARGRLVGPGDVRPADPAAWGLPPGAAAREVEIRVGDTPFHALLYDDPGDPARGFDAVRVRRGGRAPGGAEATLRPREAATEPGAPQPGSWSPPLEAARGELRGNVYFRLFELAPDGSRLALYQRQTHALRGVPEDRLEAYLAAYPGFHDQPFSRYVRGDLGPTLMTGGDGTAERRALEIVAHDLELVRAGTRFVQERWAPNVLLHYSPQSDGAGHAWVGVLDPASPAHDPALARRLWPFYARVFSLLDAWLGEIVARAPPGTVVAVATDHGMEGAVHDLHVNRILEEAGLVHRTADGAVDLGRTRILAADSSFFLRVNASRFAGGIVPPAEHDAVVDAAARALLAARHPATGRPLVRRVWRPRELAHLGLDRGPAGDLFLDPAPGLYPVTALADGLLSPYPAGGAGHHGFHPDRPAMAGIFVAAGPGIRPGTVLPTLRQVDLAPTLARLLDIPPPAQSEGRVIEEMLR